MKILATVLVLLSVVCMLQAAPNLKSTHQALATYYGDRADLENSEHAYVSQDGQMYSVLYNKNTMSFYTELANGKKFYVVAQFEKVADDQMTVAYRYNINNGERTAAFDFKVEYQMSDMSRSYKIVPGELTRGWTKECWVCLLKCVGTGTGCGICIAAPTCWGTWGVGCLACVAPCAGAVAQCIQCDVCF